MIAKFHERGFVKGLGCQDDTNTIINLHCTDDTLIFRKKYQSQAMILKWIMCCYKMWSGL